MAKQSNAREGLDATQWLFDVTKMTLEVRIDTYVITVALEASPRPRVTHT